MVIARVMSIPPTPFEALQSAVAAVGTQAALAAICGVSQPAVWKWLQSSKRIPAEFVLRVEAATGVSRHALRPDIYPIEHRQVSSRFHAVDGRAKRVSFKGHRISKAARA